MAAVEIMCRTIFCARAAFMRVEPARTSGPLLGTMAMRAARVTGEPGFAVTATVAARRVRA